MENHNVLFIFLVLVKYTRQHSDQRLSCSSKVNLTWTCHSNMLLKQLSRIIYRLYRTFVFPSVLLLHWGGGGSLCHFQFAVLLPSAYFCLASLLTDMTPPSSAGLTQQHLACGPVGAGRGLRSTHRSRVSNWTKNTFLYFTF